MKSTLVFSVAGGVLTAAVGFWALRESEPPSPVAVEPLTATPKRSAPLATVALQHSSDVSAVKVVETSGHVEQPPITTVETLETAEQVAATGAAAAKRYEAKMNTPLPVAVSLQSAPSGGLEVSLRNTSSETIEFGATLTDPQNNTRAELEFAAEPQVTHILGVNDGWKLESGFLITVTSPPYSEQVLKVP